METIELSSVDTRLEHTRTRNTEAEQRLLASIMQRDIIEPLQVCQEKQGYVLLDGFKRYRCARKLNKGVIAVECIGEDVSSGVLSLLRRNSARSLTTLEQAAFIEELHQHCGMSIYAIAERLERSPSWVSMRLAMIGQLSEVVRNQIQRGAFPSRVYMYGIKGFTRVNKLSVQQVDALVSKLSGTGLSVRQLMILTRAYISGGWTMQRLVLEADVHQALRIITSADEKTHISSNDTQHQIIKDLKLIAALMQRLIRNAGQSVADTAGLNLCSGAVLQYLDAFTVVVKEWYDRSGPTDGSTDHVPSGGKPQSDSPAVTH